MANAAKRKRLNAEERTMRMIDRWNVLDAIEKTVGKEKKVLTTKLRNIVKRSGRRGVFFGHQSVILTSDQQRSIIDQEKVLQYVGEAKFPKCFKKIKFILLQGGSLTSPPAERDESISEDDSA